MKWNDDSLLLLIILTLENLEMILQQTNNYSESSQTMTLTSLGDGYCAKYIAFTGKLSTIQYLIFYTSNLVSI